MSSQRIFHVVSGSESPFEDSTLEYCPKEFSRDGFIHCSYRQQLQGVLERHFSDSMEIVVLELDRSQILSSVIDENTSGGEELFPHIYGPIESRAVKSVSKFARMDGQFDLSTLSA